MLKWPERLLWLVGGAVLAAFLALAAFEQPADSSRSPIFGEQSDSETSANYGSQSLSARKETFRERLLSDPTAASTVALAAFTFVLAWVAIIQINFLARADDTAHAQISLANRQHFLTHRPHLTVRNVRARTQTLGVGNPIEIEFEVLNNGSSEAVILASWFEAHLATQSYDEFPPPKVHDPPRNFIGPANLKVNAVWSKEPFVSEEKWTQAHFHWTATTGFFWVGKILYLDGNGESRRLGIIRKFDPPSGRFRPLDKPDPDYEYDD